MSDEARQPPSNSESQPYTPVSAPSDDYVRIQQHRMPPDEDGETTPITVAGLSPGRLKPAWRKALAEVSYDPLFVALDDLAEDDAGATPPPAEQD